MKKNKMTKENKRFLIETLILIPVVIAATLLTWVFLVPLI